MDKELLISLDGELKFSESGLRNYANSFESLYVYDINLKQRSGKRLATVSSVTQPIDKEKIKFFVLLSSVYVGEEFERDEDKMLSLLGSENKVKSISFGEIEVDKYTERSDPKILDLSDDPTNFANNGLKTVEVPEKSHYTVKIDKKQNREYVVEIPKEYW